MFLTYPQIDKVYRRLSEVKESFGPGANRRDRAVVMIGICILEGFDTRAQIIKALGAKGLSKTHVAAILDEQTGDVPGVHLWRLDQDRSYHLVENTPALSAADRDGALKMKVDTAAEK